MGQGQTKGKGGFSFLSSFGGFGLGAQPAEPSQTTSTNVTKFGRFKKSSKKFTPFALNQEKLFEPDRSAFEDVSMENMEEQPTDRSAFVNKPQPRSHFTSASNSHSFTSTTRSNPFTSATRPSNPFTSTPRSNPFNSTYDRRSIASSEQHLSGQNRRSTIDFGFHGRPQAKISKPNSNRRATIDFLSPNSSSRRAHKPSPFVAFSNPKKAKSAFSSSPTSNPFHYSDAAQRPRTNPQRRRRRNPFAPPNHEGPSLNVSPARSDPFRAPRSPSRPNPLSRTAPPPKRARRNHIFAPTDDDDVPEKRSRPEELDKRKKRKFAPSKRYRNVKRTREDPSRFKRYRPKAENGVKRPCVGDPVNPLLRKKRSRPVPDSGPKNPSQKRGREGPMPQRKKRVHVEKKAEILQHLARDRKKANPSKPERKKKPSIPTKAETKIPSQPNKSAPPDPSSAPSIPTKPLRTKKRNGGRASDAKSVPKAKPTKVPKPPKKRKSAKKKVAKPTIAEAANERLRQLKQKEKEEKRSARRKDIAKEKVSNEMKEMKRRFKYDPLGLLRYLHPESRLSLRPSKKEKLKAYRKALKQYHPDRSQKLGLEQRVRSEETFKLLNDFKDRILKSSRR